MRPGGGESVSSASGVVALADPAEGAEPSPSSRDFGAAGGRTSPGAPRGGAPPAARDPPGPSATGRPERAARNCTVRSTVPVASPLSGSGSAASAGLVGLVGLVGAGDDLPSLPRGFAESAGGLGSPGARRGDPLSPSGDSQEPSPGAGRPGRAARSCTVRSGAGVSLSGGLASEVADPADPARAGEPSSPPDSDAADRSGSPGARRRGAASAEPSPPSRDFGSAGGRCPSTDAEPPGRGARSCTVRSPEAAASSEPRSAAPASASPSRDFAGATGRRGVPGARRSGAPSAVDDAPESSATTAERPGLAARSCTVRSGVGGSASGEVVSEAVGSADPSGAGELPLPGRDFGAGLGRRASPGARRRGGGPSVASDSTAGPPGRGARNCTVRSGAGSAGGEAAAASGSAAAAPADSATPTEAGGRADSGGRAWGGRGSGRSLGGAPVEDSTVEPRPGSGVAGRGVFPVSTARAASSIAKEPNGQVGPPSRD